MVKGIGHVYAKKLVERSGEKIFDIIEQQSVGVADVGGIGPKSRQRIKDALAEQKVAQLRPVAVPGVALCDGTVPIALIIKLGTEIPEHTMQAPQAQSDQEQDRQPVESHVDEGFLVDPE